MNVSTLLSSTVAAVSLVGAIGLAYAQSTPATPQGQTAMPADSTPMRPALQGQQGERVSAGSTAPDTSVVINERAAQSDRN